MATLIGLTRLRKALGVVSNLDNDMQINTLLVLLSVAQGDADGVSMQDLEKQVGISQAAMSRNVAALTTTTAYRTEGPGLVERFEDPMNRRSKLVRLTAKGRRVVDQINTAMQ